MNEVQGTATIDYNVLKKLESQAAAYRALDPESAKKGAEVIKTAFDIFTIESEHNGEGVLSVNRTDLYALIQLVTGVNPIEVKVVNDDMESKPVVKI
jgi:hypothetical protein